MVLKNFIKKLNKSILNNCISNNININTSFGLLAPLQNPDKINKQVTIFRPVILPRVVFNIYFEDTFRKLIE